MTLLNYFLIKKSILFSLLLSLLVLPSTFVLAQPSSSAKTKNPRFLANLGAYFWEKGDLTNAIEAWLLESSIYQDQGLIREKAQVTLKIAQTYLSLKQLDLAIFQLEQLLSLNLEPSFLARVWNQLGNAYSLAGELDLALNSYKKSLEFSHQLSTLNNLLKLLDSKVKYAQLQAVSSKPGEQTEHILSSIQFYRSSLTEYAQQALLLSEQQENPQVIQTLIHWAFLSPQGLSLEQLERGRTLLQNLPPSSNKIFLALNWAKIDVSRANYWLSDSAQIAQILGDNIAQSYVQLDLALSAENSGKLDWAKQYSYSALALARTDSVYAVLYPSSWLLARIYQREGKNELALNYYQDAINSFESLNRGVTHIPVEQRLNFPQQVEPMYRATLDLLLHDANPTQFQLQQSKSILARLQKAQLQNYFGDDCFDLLPYTQQSNEFLAAKNSVVLSSIVQLRQTHFILTLPDGTLHHRAVDLPQASLIQLATDWRNSMAVLDSTPPEGQRNIWGYWQLGEKMYDLILRPFEPQLQQINPHTIIFVHDGIFRNLPMSALFDGEKFLAQKWASFSSIPLKRISKPKSPSDSKALAFGLAEPKGSWSPLDSVSEEVENLIDLLGGRQFLNQDFTSNRFLRELSQNTSSTLHVASHAYFGELAENSFLLAYDKSLNALELQFALSQTQGSIELLFFSACETSLGSNFSVLGLAGVAKRTGVNSVLGTFWTVQDNEHSELIDDFYNSVFLLNLNRAQALQQVQIKQIEKNAHPSKWAALNLIGDY